MPTTAPSTASIAERLDRLHSDLEHVLRQTGRPPESVKLVAVSKKQPVTAIAAAVAAGQLRFGENQVQEALPKLAHFSRQGLEWHYIGHLQSNKARFIPGNFTWLHSLTSLALAERLARPTPEPPAVLNALIEVNVTHDPAKQGIAPERLDALLESLLQASLHNIRLRGLMTIGPYPATRAERRACFAALRALRDACARRFGLPAFTELSMGMSGDFVEAIQEGATLVRLGTAVFGDRM